MKNKRYTYHRISILNGSRTQRGLEKEVARRVGITSPATLISESIHDLYEKLAEEGNEDIDLLSLATRVSLQTTEKPSRPERRTNGARGNDLSDLDDNLGEFLQENF